MDVRCEQCKTEYEFDDARITEAGVTVKCTTCGHLFKVKKKALVVTVPVKPGEGEAEASPASPATPPQREWKVRQANGNVFTFKELTTLQKWIVERKVARDDEISLTGDSWKRLGNIAELASFFQVVEEAQKASQLAALQNQGLLGSPMLTPAGGYPIMPKVPGAEGAPMVFQPPAAAPAPAPVSVPAPAPLPAPAQPQVRDTQPMAIPREPAREPGLPQAAAREDLDDDFDPAAFQKRGGAGKWLLLLLLLASGGGAAYYYHQYLPAERAAEAERARLEEEKLARERAEEEAARAKAEAERKEAEELATRAAALDAGIGADGRTALAAAVVDAGVAKPQPARDFEYWMAQGDRLRERERGMAALDAYGKAVDLKPDRAEPYAGKGMALLDMGQPLQAEATFQQALKLNGRYGVALIGLAEVYRAQGKNQKAIQYYEKYLDVLPHGPEAQVAKNAIQRLKE